MNVATPELDAPTNGDFSVAVDCYSESEWIDLLAGFSDASLYQTWSYGAVRWGRSQLSHLALLHGDQVVAAAQLRIVKLPLVSAGIAYLRWGPLCHPRGLTLDSDVLTAMFSALRREYVGRRGLNLEVIPNAFIGTPRGVLFEIALSEGGLRPRASQGSYCTFEVDLSPDSEQIRKNLNRKWRNHLNRSEKNGIEWELSVGGDAYGRFLDLYDEMWERKRFKTTVDVREFGKLQEQLASDEKMKIFLAFKEGELVGAVICSRPGDSAIYVLGATNEVGRNLKAAYFLQWRVMMHLKAAGINAYDLGGANSESNRGGYDFKKGFGGSERIQVACHSLQGSILSRGFDKFAGFLRRR